MTRNILDLTNKPSVSSKNLLATNTSLNHLSEFKGTNSQPNRTRNPLPIFEPRTGKEIILETDSFHMRNLQPVPAPYIPKPPSQPNVISPTKNTRKPLPIINPKTGEVVTNPAFPTSPSQKRAIPIINPKTGTELDTSSPPRSDSSSLSSNTNIIRTPFMVMINRPVKKTPNVLHSTYPMSNSQISIPPSRQTVSKQSPIFHSEYPNIWSKSRQPHEWPLSSHSDLNTGLSFPFQEIEEEEEESEVDKYDWTPCLGYGMSFFDDDESVYQNRRVLGLNGQVTVW
jgi:hypothetical protein